MYLPYELIVDTLEVIDGILPADLYSIMSINCITNYLFCNYLIKFINIKWINLVPTNVDCNNNLNRIKYFTKTYTMNREYCISWILLFISHSRNYFRPIKWLIKILKITKKDIRHHNIFMYSCLYGCLKIVQYLIRKFHITETEIKNDIHYISCIICNHYPKIIEWSIKKFNITKNDLTFEFKEGIFPYRENQHMLKIIKRIQKTFYNSWYDRLGFYVYGYDWYLRN